MERASSSVGGLRFGVQCALEATSLDELTTLWKSAEALGYDWISFPDHLRPSRRAPDAPCFDTIALLAALATSTERVRIGTLTLSNGFRHPAVLARTLATIDHLSGGRLEVGIGAGWDAEEYTAYGLDFPSPGERVRRLAEAVRVLKALWTEERATFGGRFYTLREAICMPKPKQAPHPPIWIGGAGEQRLLALVAQHADGWSTGFRPPYEYAHKAEVLARHCAEVGRDPGTIKRSIVATVVCAERDEEAHHRMTALEASFGGPLHRAQNLVGSGESCADRLRVYLELGVTDFIVRVYPGLFGEPLLESFLRLVAPRLREAAKGSGSAPA